MASDYVFIRKSRNIFSNILHVLFNLSLGVGSIFVSIVSGSWIIGAILVLVSKWRMFAVRPRFWFLNLKANLVDLIVGLSFVLIGYFSGTELLPIHYILAGGYSLWLIFVKPKTSESWNRIQALTAVFLGTSATTIACANYNPVFLVISVFIIGYAATRHILAQNNSSTITNGYPALIMGAIFAEIALLFYAWLIVYTFSAFGIMIPQLAIILVLFAFMSEKIYSSVESRDGHFKFSEVALPVLFSFALLAVIIFGFSEPLFNI